MNKIRVCFILMMITILCCACKEASVESESTLVESETEVVETVAVKDEDVVNEIDGYIKADYELYTSSELTEAEIRQDIFVKGTVEQCMEHDFVLGFCLRDEKENLWLVGLDEAPVCSRQTVETLIGHEVIVFGNFWTCSEEHVPAVNISDRHAYIQIPDMEKEMYLEDFAAERDEVILWFEENTEEIFFDESFSAFREGAGTYVMSTGVVERVEDYPTGSYWIDFFQQTEEGYMHTWIDYNEVFYDETEKSLEFSYGDGIRLYYYINELNDTELYAIEHVDAGFTIQDVKEEYISGCEEYTYKEIARNPESVRGEYAQVTGKVVQVISQSGSTFVYLRINITPNQYGSYEDTIYVSYRYKTDSEDRILEDDIVTVYGKLTGTETYTSVLGASITLPRITGEYIDIHYE